MRGQAEPHRRRSRASPAVAVQVIAALLALQYPPRHDTAQASCVFAAVAAAVALSALWSPYLRASAWGGVAAAVSVLRLLTVARRRSSADDTVALAIHAVLAVASIRGFVVAFQRVRVERRAQAARRRLLLSRGSAATKAAKKKGR